MARAAASHAENAGESNNDPHGSVDYADPGYQADGKKRYPLETERDIRAAWAFVHQAANARRYSAGQLKRIKALIIAAWQAKIDPAGPPAAPSEPGMARKSLAEADCLARIVADLDWLRARLAVADASGSPLPQRLDAILAELCDVADALVTEQSVETVGGGNGAAEADLAAMTFVGTLRKARQPDAAPLSAGLAKLADEIIPRLDALQKRVEEIAATPLPPQTMARGFAAIAKREDGGGALSATADLVAAIARMSEEERTLILIKAAHAHPTTPLGRPVGLATR